VTGVQTCALPISEALAEELRKFLALDFAKATMTEIAPRIDKAVAALAAWEAKQ
jgi:hypothetical protein